MNYEIRLLQGFCFLPIDSEDLLIGSVELIESMDTYFWSIVEKLVYL